MTYYRESGDAQSAGITYHLVPEPVWAAASDEAEYLPEAYATDGFIHCTNGTDPLLEVANLFYAADRRDFQVLAIDVAKIASEVRYDDPEGRFPHIYGPLNTDAVIDRFHVTRDADGAFVSIDR